MASCSGRIVSGLRGLGVPVDHIGIHSAECTSHWCKKCVFEFYRLSSGMIPHKYASLVINRERGDFQSSEAGRRVTRYASMSHTLCNVADRCRSTASSSGSSLRPRHHRPSSLPPQHSSPHLRIHRTTNMAAATAGYATGPRWYATAFRAPTYLASALQTAIIR